MGCGAIFMLFAVTFVVGVIYPPAGFALAHAATLACVLIFLLRVTR